MCRCRAYTFPHRLFGGKCKQAKWVARFWSKNPHSSNCTDCHCYRQHECEVVQGVESARHAECLMEHISTEEIKVYWKKE